MREAAITESHERIGPAPKRKNVRVANSAAVEVEDKYYKLFASLLRASKPVFRRDVSENLMNDIELLRH